MPRRSLNSPLHNVKRYSILLTSLLVAALAWPTQTLGDMITASVLFGDSFSNNSVDWPTYTSIPFQRFADGGRRLSYIDTQFTSQLDSVNPATYDGIVVMAGINDVFNNSELSTLQNHVNSIRAKAPAGKKLIFATLPPALGHSQWNTSKQAVLESFNSWLLMQPGPVFDLNSILDSNNDEQLDAAWNGRDFLHPTNGPQGGMGHIARQFDQFNAVPEPNLTAGAFLALLVTIGFRRPRRR